MKERTDEQGDLHMESEPGTELCDFCNELKPSRFFKAVDVFLTHDDEGHALWSKGDWAACDTCALLINTGNRVGLRERSYYSLKPWERTVASRKVIELIHTKFFESRKL
jgi:hypothetical protein